MKLTHDGAVAVIDNGRLVRCTEVEKVSNRSRHATLADLVELRSLLDDIGVALADLPNLVIDGWIPGPDGLARVNVSDVDGTELELVLAGYDETSNSAIEGIAHFGREGQPYRSYPHVLGHVFSAYCTSPFSAEERRALVLVWDGGMPACLFEFDPSTRTLFSHGTVLDISGALYPIFSASLDVFAGAIPSPFSSETTIDPGVKQRYLSLSGKAMAYAGLGAADEVAVASMADITSRIHPRNVQRSRVWARQALRALAGANLSDAVILASFQEYLGRTLIQSLREKLGPRWGDMPLCLAGGCALNIKWNSAIRASGGFTGVWVPPFPNDAGSAIGAACAEMVKTTGHVALEWDVFSGPALRRSNAPAEWRRRPAPIEDVASILHTTGEPVVVLTGASELGPRALGHRSIIAPATGPGMKDRLNEIKRREPYRPVAPICLEERAPAVFSPGTPDEFMLFDHAVKPAWRTRIPAVVHADGTARLQTVTKNHVLHSLLSAYEALSGIPVLCNTSANFAGCGFFPDVGSALEWGGTDLVWAENTLYFKSHISELVRPVSELPMPLTSKG